MLLVACDGLDLHKKEKKSMPGAYVLTNKRKRQKEKR
jgi:hypothetical protein